MDDNVETSRPESNLTGAESSQESVDGSTEPTEDRSESGEGKVIAGFQRSLQEAREREKKTEKQLADLRRELRRLNDEKKKAELGSMSEADQYKALAEEEQKKRAMLEIELLIKDSVEGKNIPPKIVKLLRKSPWAIPEVQDELGDDYSWDDVIDSVTRHLPDYVNSFVEPEEAPTTEDLEEIEAKVDAERSTDFAVTRNHIYTREEVARIQAAGPDEWEKHREAIMAQMARSGGALPE